MAHYVSCLLTTAVLGSPEIDAVASCVSSPLMTAFLGSPGCEWLRDPLRFQPTDDARPRLSSWPILDSPESERMFSLLCFYAWITPVLDFVLTILIPDPLASVILIFKHATFLRLDGLSSESALTQAELDYREANVDLKIQEHLTGSSQDSVELSASFLMATYIEPSRTSVKAHVHGKEHWFKRLLKPAFPRKS
ncbi:hypothetical protein EDB83DRAFT_2520649 [Lactarius deliciosus]|nr:hypothetical protein EDB83DRAFT_2520649 [Lactarius deliciosus]